MVTPEIKRVPKRENASHAVSNVVGTNTNGKRGGIAAKLFNHPLKANAAVTPSQSNRMNHALVAQRPVIVGASLRGAACRKPNNQNMATSATSNRKMICASEEAWGMGCAC